MNNIGTIATYVIIGINAIFLWRSDPKSWEKHWYTAAILAIVILQIYFTATK